MPNYNFENLIDLNHLHLFGNQAAEDEDPVILNSYFVEKPEFRSFQDDETSLAIVKALKGMGKSAFLSQLSFLKQNESPKPIVVYVTGSDLVSYKPFKTTTPLEMIDDWQQRICSRINIEIGKQIGIALDDTSISLVEAAELADFKGKNIVKSLLDRFKFKLGNIEIADHKGKNPLNLLKRYSEKDLKKLVWLIIDDIDATFKRNEEECLRISTFFTACRMLVNTVKSLNIRTSVRTDVWTTIYSTDEALDKVQQYIFNIKWDNPGTKSIISKRIFSYLNRKFSGKNIKNLPQLIFDALGKNSFSKYSEFKNRVITEDVSNNLGACTLFSLMQEDELIALIFPDDFGWGKGNPSLVVHALSSGRPRWALELCRISQAEAVKNNSEIITYGFIKAVLEKFGNSRIDDFIKEHYHQCEQLPEIIQAFSKQYALLTIDDLDLIINANIISKFDVYIEGQDRPEKDPYAIANFLFRIGFINACYYPESAIMAKYELDKKNKIEYFRYDEKPYLLHRNTPIDPNFLWSIQPSIVKALRLKNLSPKYF